jgi:cellulose synthase/poly-beta-1,6-N-acetylglucosamine synthase-like glycosyltransferase
MLAAVVLAVASAVVFHIIVGYPILLAFLTRRAAPPVQNGKDFRAVVSVLPAVRNREEIIRGKLECLLGLDYAAQSMEILVVSDEATDAPEAIDAALLAVAVFVVPPETLWRPTRVKVRRR